MKKRRPIYETTAIQYDVFGNLLKHGKVSYKIDPLNRRLSRTIDGVLTNMYAYNPEGQMIAELDQNGRLLKYFIYGSRKHVPDYFVDTNNERFKIITDHLGSVRYVVNSSTGEVKLKMNHDDFGKVLVDTNPGYLPFGFAGGVSDFKTGLVRFGARDYDSQIGRWTSKDPIGFDGGDTNLFGYVLQDPVNYIDLTGESPTAVIGGGIGTIILPGPGTIIGGIIGGIGGIYLGDIILHAYSKGGQQNVKDSGLAGLSDDEISRRARDKSLPANERLRYQKEEKARGLRNKKKRECN